MSTLFIDDTYPELLADIARAIHSQLMDRAKLPHAQAAEIAMSVTEHVRKNIGGVSVYVSKGVQYEATMREREIYEAFDGKNHHILARQHNLSEMRIRQIVSKVGAIERAKRQTNLFPTD